MRSAVAIVFVSLIAASGCEKPQAPRAPREAFYTDDTSPSVIPKRPGWADDDAGVGDGGVEFVPDDGTDDVYMARSESFDGYLASRGGHALYMFANDRAGDAWSACQGACRDKFRPFDIVELNVGKGLVKSDFKRFHRDDGLFQTSYRGYPLYTHAEDTKGTVRGDGADGRWFVARNYALFLAARTNIAPDAGEVVSTNVPFLVSGAGRSLYVYKSDTAAADGEPPVSSCTGMCVNLWPPWMVSGSTDESSLIVPSLIDTNDLSHYTRPDGAVQITYRGWPLYLYSEDEKPGEVAGHNVGAWRVIDPTTFADAT